MDYCSYYQAYVDKKTTWFFVAILRSHEHLSFDRTLDKETGLFEFFVPKNQENDFCELMDQLNKQKIISELKKLPNRLKDPSEKL